MSPLPSHPEPTPTPPPRAIDESTIPYHCHLQSSASVTIVSIWSFRAFERSINFTAMGEPLNIHAKTDAPLPPFAIISPKASTDGAGEVITDGKSDSFACPPSCSSCSGDGRTDGVRSTVEGVCVCTCSPCPVASEAAAIKLSPEPAAPELGLLKPAEERVNSKSGGASISLVSISSLDTLANWIRTEPRLSKPGNAELSLLSSLFVFCLNEERDFKRIASPTSRADSRGAKLSLVFFRAPMRESLSRSASGSDMRPAPWTLTFEDGASDAGSWMRTWCGLDEYFCCI